MPAVEPSFERYNLPVHTLADTSCITSESLGTKFVCRFRESLPEDLYFLSYLRPGGILFVTFHGAVRRGVDTYPRFDRVGSLRKAGVPFLAFADPTISVDEELELGWYLGGSGWDPKDAIVSVIDAVKTACDAKGVCLIGGSGGGFAALRVSREIPQSLAFVFNPQVRLRDYIPRVKDLYFSKLYSRDSEAVINDSPAGLYDLSVSYQGGCHPNFVYFLQNLTDVSHLKNHYKPFKDAVGISGIHGVDPTGSIRMELIDSSRVGHSPPSPEEFDQHLSTALDWYKDVVSLR